jgi:hypothetical protein
MIDGLLEVTHLKSEESTHPHPSDATGTVHHSQRPVVPRHGSLS